MIYSMYGKLAETHQQTLEFAAQTMRLLRDIKAVYGIDQLVVNDSRWELTGPLSTAPEAKVTEIGRKSDTGE